MNLRTYNLPPGVTLSDLEGPENDADGMIEQLERNADEAYERAQDAEIQQLIDSAHEAKSK